MNDVATAGSLQEWSALLCCVCYMCVGFYNRVITPVQGVACLLYVSRHSIQRDNPVLVAFSNTGCRLQITDYKFHITDSGVICEEITFNLIR
jgi:hypothetical protein